VPRPRLRLLLAALPLVAACGSREVVIAPEPPRPAVEVTEPTAPAPAPAPAPGGPTSPDQGLPPATNGVLPPGAADKILPVGAQPIVKLLEPGAEPRSDLSYALTKGSSQKLAMTMDTAMNVKVGGQGQPSTLPRMTMTFDNAAADRNAAGELSIESRLTGVSVDPAGGQQEQLANALRPQLEGMKGLGMLYWVNPKGRVHDVKMDIPKGMPPAAQQLLGGMSHSFESMVTPLPAEPVGVGAKWQVVSRASSGGADLLQAAIYTLKSRAGSRATLDVSMMQLAAKDSIHTPQMPANMSLKVVAFSSAGTGTTQVDLKSVAPEAGTMTLKASMTLAVPPQSPGAASDETSVDTTTTVQVARP
jgi:hypothetical protein